MFIGLFGVLILFLYSSCINVIGLSCLFIELFFGDSYWIRFLYVIIVNFMFGEVGVYRFLSGIGWGISFSFFETGLRFICSIS